MSSNPNLALVGMHGPPEITGQALKQSCDNSPIEGWDIEIANQKAIEAGTRYVSYNMSMQFGCPPPAEKTDANYELWRPAEIRNLAGKYKRILEVHDSPYSRSRECMAVGGVYEPDLLRLAAQLGIWSVISQRGIPTFNNDASHSITLELGRDDCGNPRRQLRENVERLRECMRVAAVDTLPQIDPAAFAYYEYETEIHWRQATALGLERMGALEPFEPLPAPIIERLGLSDAKDTVYVAEYWNGYCSAPGQWFGGVLRRVQPPMTQSVAD